MIRSLKTTRYALLLLPFFQLSYANLTIETAKTIQGTQPRLSEDLENELLNNGELKQLFGLRIDHKDYYGEEGIASMPVPINHPFKNRFIPAQIKQPNENEYFDRDGDKLSYILPADPSKDIKMQWYYTDSRNNDIAFTPKDTDTFCSLSAEGKFAPYKVKLSTDLVLFSESGDPDHTTYPNDVIKNQPSATFTVIDDIGICFAKPSLRPNLPSSDKDQWIAQKGFKTQSNTDPTKNFPNTGFVGAKFELILSQTNLYANYEWNVKQGNDLVTVTKDARTNIPTVIFNGPDAKDTEKAWEHVMGGSGDGYPVVIEGKNTKTGKIIQYAFTITKWFDTWEQTVINNIYYAKIDTVAKVVAACKKKPGHYRLSQTSDVTNAIEPDTAKTIYITREIGTLFSEWGDVDQLNYPGSFAPNVAGTYKFFYVEQPSNNKVCDIHIDTGIYHCRPVDTELKNAVCASYRP
ncbi:hypothetical protein J3U21_07960 [Gilliamella sp. B2776]|uniref:hypothetical protein n=1 Tax=unclassified Gilliamella TaxID=2685620 RepID=UPI00226AF09F|nr:MULTISPECIES: hypothetical protein [unclassified Gilliamella]MCX8650310.1 hypothetical protein [Gilliamella sp. B2779]MCX8654171.1 hypothetical protein [Gilliamella sp. B2737]MCX8655969.1 hypothetical protein [Gilliamella sp. B2894]MCX8664073.1 hypothetical protein [Gilliamella sp. B2887]MCX8692083.1 hypothetical protein [Gilliamella sp. B2776]